jgi:hypothetical protein
MNDGRAPSPQRCNSILISRLPSFKETVTATVRHRSTRIALRLVDLLLDCFCLLLAPWDGDTGIPVSSLAELAAAFAERKDAPTFHPARCGVKRAAHTGRAGPRPGSANR